MIKSQAEEIAELTSWLRTWYDVNPDAAERGKVIQDSALSIQYAKAAIHAREYTTAGPLKCRSWP